MVFAANSGTVVDGRVLGARFRAPQRTAEADHFRRWFLDHGYRDVVMPAAINEAEGDFAWTGQFLLAGTGFRTDPAAHAEAQEVLGVPVVSLQLVDPRYYHLDTALFVLRESTPDRPAHIAYYPEAFSPGSQRVLARLFPDAIIANAADAECLGLNGVSDGRNVVLPMEATHLAAQLINDGLRADLRGHLRTTQVRRRPQVLHAGDQGRVTATPAPAPAVRRGRSAVPRRQRAPAAGRRPAGRRISPAGTFRPGQPSAFHGHAYGHAAITVRSVRQPVRPSIAPIGSGGVAVVGVSTTSTWSNRRPTRRRK